jgi:hypothetical protein
MSLDPARREALLNAKLAALVRENGPGRDWLSSANSLSLGADVVLHDDTAGIAWVLLDADHLRGLGRALTWATAHAVAQLHLFVDEADAPDVAGHLARRAGLLSLPDGAPDIWSVQGRDARRAAPSTVEPAPSSHGREADALATFLRENDVEVVTEHTCVIGEVVGLEVARTVHADDGVRLEVGVGRHDREAAELLHGRRDPREALPAVAALVRSHRSIGAPSHPLNRLAPQRWLLRHLVEHPALIGLASLEPVVGPLPRGAVDDVVPAFGVGRDVDGTPVVVATSVGVDIDVVPAALDAWAQHAPEARLLVVVPERDALPSLQRVAALAITSVEIVTVPDGWRG